MITRDDFRQRRWDRIDPVIEAQNARLPEGWYWECGGTCAHLYSPPVVEGDVSDGRSQRAWAHSDGTWTGYPPSYENSLGTEVYSGKGVDFSDVLRLVTDMALSVIGHGSKISQPPV